VSTVTHVPVAGADARRRQPERANRQTEEVAMFSHGAWIVLLVEVIMFFGVVWGYYTLSGSGINARPFGDRYDSASGARGKSAGASGRDELVSVRNWTRGTR